MAIVQDTFFIPDDITVGLATGLYRRIGSVVRYAVGPNKGQIVKHLQPINLETTEQAQGLGVKMLQSVQRHKKGIGIAAIGTATIGISIFGYRKWKNRDSKVLSEFRTSLKAYIAAIRIGNMDINIINALMESLEALKKCKGYKKINIQLTAEDLETLVGRIYDYTVKLARDNSIELSDDELNTNSGAIINLQSYLKVQKKVFESAA